MTKIKKWIKKEKRKTGILMRSIPSTVVTLFVVSVICMNLLANKELVSVKYLALDCGFPISWISFGRSVIPALPSRDMNRSRRLKTRPSCVIRRFAMT